MSVHGEKDSTDEVVHLEQQVTTTDDVSEAPQSWKNPSIMKFRLAAAFLAFFVNGSKDSAIGVVIPALQEYYNIGYFIVAIAFLAPFIGYLVAASTNDYLHSLIGRIGVLITGAVSQLAFFIIASCAPPFPLFVVGYGFAGLGSGLIEASQNALCGTLEDSNQILGLMHGMYGIGGTACPAIAQAMLAHGVPWQRIYLVLLCLSVTSLCCSSAAFFRDRRGNYAKISVGNKSGSTSFGAIMRSGLVWLIAISIFLYVGGEVSTGSWSVSYMINVRDMDPDSAGYVSTGFWLGVALGRIVLGFVSPYLGNLSLMVVFYLVVTIALSLVYWLVPHMIVSAVAAGLIGLLIGPLFPTIMAVAVQKLPKWQHVSGLGFASALGGGGAAVVPFLAGGIAQKIGPQAIAPLIFAAFTAMLLCWLLVMKLY